MSDEKKIGLGIGGVILVILLFLSISTVDTGNTGFRVTFGKVSKEVLEEGVHFKIPFVQKIVEVNNKTQKTVAEGRGASSDLQTVSYSVSVNFRVNAESSYSLYQRVGTKYKSTIITPAIQEASKSVIAKYTAEELISKRTEVSSSIKEQLGNRLKDYGISIVAINIENFDFSDEFNKAIESKQTTQQEALKAQEEYKKAEIQAQQKVMEAEKNAEAKIKEAEGEAKANELINNSISDKILNKELIEKWDGKLPVVQDSNGNSFIDINSLINKGDK